MRDIFEPRFALKPYEYPELVEYADAIRQSYWLVTQYNFTSDVQDYKVKLTEIEQEAIKRCMLAISQIESSSENILVKSSR